MDKTQFAILLGYVRSSRRLLIYILATLFGLLCFLINEFESPAWVWVLLYPVIFVFIAIVEIRIVRKRQRELEEEASTPPAQSPDNEKR
jgi:hypothetical protein